MSQNHDEHGLNMITPKQAAEETGLTKQHITRMLRSGKLPGKQIERGVSTLWWLDASSPEYKKLLPAKPEKPVLEIMPRDFPFSWPEWEYLCKTGEGNIVASPLGKRTLEEYRKCVTTFFRKRGRLTEETLLLSYREYIDKMTDETDYYSARKMLHAAIMSVARYYHYKGFVDSGFVEKLATHKPKRIKKHVSRPCYDEKTIELALKSLDESRQHRDYDRLLNKTLIQTAFYTGLRNSEICNIRLQDVDLEGQQIPGQRMIYVYRGKGRKDRQVGVPKPLYEQLKKYLAERPKTDCTYLFVSDRGNKLDNGMVSQRMQRIGKRLGIRFTPHGIRRTSATWYARKKEMPIALVSKMLGHTDLATTNLYVQVSERDVVSAMQAIQ